MKELPAVNNQPVKVYRNLKYTRPCYSVTHKGKVIGHARNVVLEHARFHVNESGRQRVIETQKKNVHAWVLGHLVYASKEEVPVLDGGSKLSYNPFKGSYFYSTDSGEKVHSADQLLLTDTGIYGIRVKWGASEETELVMSPEPARLGLFYCRLSQP